MTTWFLILTAWVMVTFQDYHLDFGLLCFIAAIWTAIDVVCFILKEVFK